MRHNIARPRRAPDQDPCVEPIFRKLAESVSGARTLEELARPMLEMLEAVTGLESTYLTRIDLEQGVQHIVYARNAQQMQIPEGLSVPWEDTLCKRALDEGRMFTDDVATCWGDSEAARALGIATYVSTPVRTDRGELYGTLCAASANTAPLPPDAERILEMFSRMIGQHVEREQLLVELQDAYGAMEASALTDALTGLPNRRRLMEELGRALAAVRRSGHSLLVAFIDINGFKRVNDRHGHLAGDRLLVELAKRLSAACRTEELVARYGGDEFVLVATHPSEGAEAAAERISERLRSTADAPFNLDSVLIPSEGLSVGTVVAGPETSSIDDVLALADVRMYQMKQGG